MAVHGATWYDFVPTHTGWLISWTVQKGMLLLTCGLLVTTLTRLVIPSETEHVSQVFTKLAGTGQASRGDTRSSISWTLIWYCSIACINHIVLALFHTFCHILRWDGWVRSRSCRSDTSIVWDARQMSCLRRVDTQSRVLWRVQANTTSAIVSWFLLRATSTHEARVDNLDRVWAGCTVTARCRSYTVSLVLIGVQDSFTARPEHTLQHGSTVLLTSCLVLLFECNLSIVRAEALVYIMWRGANPSWTCLQFHVQSVWWFDGFFVLIYWRKSAIINYLNSNLYFEIKDIQSI